MENPNEKKFEVVFYEKTNGRKPVEEFLETLNAKVEAKVIGLLNLLAKEGNELREPYSKPIGNDIYELRYQNKQQPARVLYFFYLDNKIVVTNGFIKKTKKTPRREINKAMKHMKDYIERHNNDNA